MGARPKLTEAQKVEIWQRWKAGEKPQSMAAEMHKDVEQIRVLVATTGGIPPRERSRSSRALTLSEREEISRGVCVHRSIREIARRLGRAPSSVSREIARNTKMRWQYRAHIADRRAWCRALRPKKCRLAQNPRLADVVAQKLSLKWSPQQISGWLAIEFAGDDSMQVSHETIYRSLFIQARGVLKKELSAHLRRADHIRHSRHYRPTGPGRGRIVDPVSISQRPADVNDRAIPGHWEGDLLAGSMNTHIVTLVERQSRYLMLIKVPSKDTRTVVNALSKKIIKLPRELRRSLTWDQGKEMAEHKRFTLATKVKVYFCDPHSPWQRGSNENTNGLLRQYFPKRTDLSGYSQKHLDKVAFQMNQRPRETLGFKTPADKLHTRVASIH